MHLILLLLIKEKARCGGDGGAHRPGAVHRLYHRLKPAS